MITELIIAALILISVILGFILGKKFGYYQGTKEIEKTLPKIRQDAIKMSKSVVGGFATEQLAPYLPNFKYNPSEVRFIGKPIDFLVFKGMDNKEIEEIIFVEVKTGKSQLNTNEKSLKKAIEEKKIKWEEYRL